MDAKQTQNTRLGRHIVSMRCSSPSLVSEKKKNVTLPPTHVPASSCALPEQSALVNSEDVDRRQEKRSTRRTRAALGKNKPTEDGGTELEKSAAGSRQKYANAEVSQSHTQVLPAFISQGHSRRNMAAGSKK